MRVRMRRSSSIGSRQSWTNYSAKTWIRWFIVGFIGTVFVFSLFNRGIGHRFLDNEELMAETGREQENRFIATEKMMTPETKQTTKQNQQSSLQQSVEQSNQTTETIVSSKETKPTATEQEIKVYMTDEKKVLAVPLENYVMGVVAGEMPLEFELEALKAQAIAARTYILRRLELGPDKEMKQIGADVTNTVKHQVYLSDEELQKRYGTTEQQQYLNKLRQAVEETKGEVMTYEGKAIEASFFSTGNGYTEKAADYWGSELPYLQSVASPWDKESPRFEQQFTLTKQELYQKLGLSGKQARAKLSMKIQERTEGKRIASIVINGQSFSGREVREKLGLASSEFKWKISKDEIVFTTLGYGHGVGMSQWGANGMAKEGKRAEDIVQHYYKGITIEQVSKLAI